MADWDWTHIAAQAAGSAISGAVGLLVGVWKAGRSTGRREVEVDAKIEGARNDMTAQMAAMEKHQIERNELLVDQFKESFAGLRRQMDENKLHTEENFLRKDDFNDFRKEHREDMRTLIGKVDNLLARKQ